MVQSGYDGVGDSHRTSSLRELCVSLCDYIRDLF